MRWTKLSTRSASRADGAVEVETCAGTACHASGRPAVTAAFREELANRGLADEVVVLETGCHGFCEQGPIVLVQPKGIFYARVRATDVPGISPPASRATTSTRSDSTSTRRPGSRSRSRRTSRSTRDSAGSCSRSTGRSIRSPSTTTSVTPGTRLWRLCSPTPFRRRSSRRSPSLASADAAGPASPRVPSGTSPGVHPATRST